MAAAFDDIARILAGARKREARIVLLTAAGCGAAGALLALLLGAVALSPLSRGWGAPAGRQLSLSLAALSLLGAATWAGLALLRRAGTLEATARSLAGPDLGLSSDLVSAVELDEGRAGLAEAGYSVALADAHVARAAARAAGIDLSRALPDRAARRAGLLLGGAALLNLLALAAGGRALGAGYARLAGLGPEAPVAQADPITGDVELTFLYPAHTGRASTTVSGTGGEITAPRGTEVRLSARADRAVEAAELVVDAAGPPPAAAAPGEKGEKGEKAKEAPTGPQVIALAVKDGRQLSGRLTVDAPGSYRFRFRKGRKLVAEGPPIPIAVEPDLFPEVRVTQPAPGSEVEVDARARLRVDWTASDDFGLTELALVTKAPGGAEERKVLRSFQGARRESGTLDLEVAGFRLGEGEKLLYWLEVLDNDAVSGPKRGVSSTQAVKIYSEAEHRRKLLEEAQALWERMVALLGDRLELIDGLARWTPPLLARGQAADGKAKGLHEALREAARAMRREKGAPRSVPDALANAAAGLRAAEQPLSHTRATAVRVVAGVPPDDPFWRRLGDQDAAMDRELEKDVLYLEQLFDKERAQDLVRLAKELQARRRDLAGLLEKYRQAPGEEARRQLLAEIARMRQRMAEMSRRMAELAKGIQDEHMNAEAMAEAHGAEDRAGLDQVEEALKRGDVDAAMKALDAMGSRMQEMLARLERTAGEPDQKTRALMKELRDFQQKLGEVERRQEQLAGETDQLRQAYRQKVGERLRALEEKAGRMKQLAREAGRELEQARPSISPRSEEEYGRAREALQDLEKSLSVKDLEAALESVRKALPSLQRLTVGLEDEAQLAERFPQPGQPGPGPMVLRDAERHASRAQGPAREVQQELEKLFPDPRSILSQGQQQKLEGLSRKQGELEREAGQLRRKLDELAEKAPVFPPQSQGMLSEAQGHMAQAQGDLAQRNPQRGHGNQRQALDALSRFRKGLEELAQRGGGRGGEGFPFPMAMGGGGEASDGDDGEMSREKVEIPGADAYKVPEEFRKDILEAMKQGAPEPYRPELQRYYQELVK